MIKTFKITSLFLMIINFTSCAKATNAKLIQTNEVNSIVGGEDIKTSERGKSPGDFVVGIGIPNNDGELEICTGTLVATDLVLTAAHCFIDQSGLVSSDKVRVFYGENFQNSSKDLIKQIKRLTIHPNYFDGVNENRSYDIALIKLSESAPEWKKVATLPDLPFFDELVKLNPLMAVGYGSTGAHNVQSTAGILRFVDNIQVTSNWLNPNSSKLLLANQHQGIGTCFGDSGGPLLSKIGWDTYIVGITSNTVLSVVHESERQAQKLTISEYLNKHPEIDSCSEEFGGYTNVMYHLDYVKKVMNAWK